MVKILPLPWASDAASGLAVVSDLAWEPGVVREPDGDPVSALVPEPVSVLG